MNSLQSSVALLLVLAGGVLAFSLLHRDAPNANAGAGTESCLRHEPAAESPLAGGLSQVERAERDEALGHAATLDPRVQAWLAQFERATLGQVTDELFALRRLLSETIEPYFDARFEAGEYLFEGRYKPGEAYRFMPEGDGRLAARRFLGSGVVAKVYLPRESFADAYELKSQVEWLTLREQALLEEQENLSRFPGSSAE